MKPEIKKVNGKPGQSQYQKTIERANQDIENMFTSWITDNQTNEWIEYVRSVFFIKKLCLQLKEVIRNLYEAIFTSPAKVELSSFIIPQSVLHSINAKEDWKLDSQETVIMESQWNFIQEGISISRPSTEPPTEIPEFINSNLAPPRNHLCMRSHHWVTLNFSRIVMAVSYWTYKEGCAWHDHVSSRM